MISTTTERLFELTVMFFELINSLVTFKTMINKILWDLINTEAVRSFIDVIIVKTEEEERYNKVVKKIVKKLAENDLYIK